MSKQSIATIEQQLREASMVLEAFLSDADNIRRIDRAAQIMADAIIGGGKVLSCGNGGSLCDAMHFAEELTGRFRESRAALAAVAMADASHITCVGNDYGFEHIFSKYLEGVGKPGDVLLAISTSGNSKNVLLAAEKAKEKQISIVALTGKSGGELASLADVEIRAPHNGYSDRIQEIHIKVIHILVMLIEQKVLS